MNGLDAAILILLAVQLYLGYRRGFWLTALIYVGASAGFVLAVAVAAYVLRQLEQADETTRLVVTSLLLLGGTMIGGEAGGFAGRPVRSVVGRVLPLRLLDALAGALLTGAVTLALVWYASLAISRVPQFAVSSTITDSAVLRQLDRVASHAPPLVAELEHAISTRISPDVFAGLEPRFPSDFVPDPATAAEPAVTAAAEAVVRIAGLGCGGLRVGSGFPVGDGMVVTNAHVLSGTDTITVQRPAGRAVPATVVAFDPDLDIAVLVAPELALPALPLADGEPGSAAAMIGYPGGGDEVITPAVIVRRVRARGRDIYGEDLVTREIWVVRGVALPGDSGGPLVDTDGRAVGVVFAASTSQRETAYALTMDEVLPVLDRARGLSEPIDTAALECVR